MVPIFDNDRNGLEPRSVYIPPLLLTRLEQWAYKHHFLYFLHSHSLYPTQHLIRPTRFLTFKNVSHIQRTTLRWLKASCVCSSEWNRNSGTHFHRRQTSRTQATFSAGWLFTTKYAKEVWRRLSVREQSDDVEANTCRCDILLLFHLSLIFTKVSRRLFSTPCFSHLMYRSPTHCFKTQVLSCPSHIPP